MAVAVAMAMSTTTNELQNNLVIATIVMKMNKWNELCCFFYLITVTGLLLPNGVVLDQRYGIVGKVCLKSSETLHFIVCFYDSWNVEGALGVKVW